jgi:hypothetical protein
VEERRNLEGIKMVWHEKVLDKSGRDAARRLALAVGGNFYLAGGGITGKRAILIHS